MAFGTPTPILGNATRNANGTTAVTATGSVTVALNDLLTHKIGANTVSSLDAGWTANDNLGNTWAVDVTKVQGTSGQQAILSCRVTNPGTLTLITLTPANSCGRIVGFTEQTTGVLTSGTYLDTTAVGSGTSLSPLTAASAALASTGELGMVGVNVAAGATFTSANGTYTLESGAASTNGTTDRRTGGSYKVGVGTASEQPGFAISSSVAWAIVFAAYKPATAATQNATASITATASLSASGTLARAAAAAITASASLAAAGTTIPATPTGLTATGGRGEVDLAWTAVPDATSYNVYRGGVLQWNTLEASGVDTTGTVGTSYAYTVTAVNSGGESAQSSSASASSTALPAVATSAATFRTALASTATTPVRVMAIGDSIAEGQGATTVANRWLDKFVTNTRVTYQPGTVAGGVGFRPGKFTSTSLPAPATLAGSPSSDFTLGPGGRSLFLNGSGKSITFTVSGTSVDVMYATAPGAGTFSVSIDGGAATNINTNTGTGVVDAVVRRFTFGTRGSHTVALAWASGTAYGYGVIVYDQDETAGIRTYDASHLGWSSTDYMSNLEKTTQHPITNLMTTVDPQLVIVNLATNDWLHGESLAALRTNLTNLMTLLGSTRSVVFLPAYKTDRSLETSTMVADWSQYVGVMYAVANAYSNVTIVDLSQLMPNVVGDVLGYYADQYHPNNTGHAQIASLLGTALLPGSVTLNGAAAITATASVSAAPTLTSQAAAVLAQVASMIAGATLTRQAAASITATAAVTAGATLTQQAAATITPAAALVAGATLTSQVTATVTQTAALVAGATYTGVSAATITPTAAVVAGGIVTKAAAAAITPTASLTAGAVVTVNATAAITAVASVSASGTASGSGASATITPTASLTAGAVVTAVAAATITSVAALVAGAIVTRPGAATITATASLTAAAVTTRPATASITALAALQAAAGVTENAAVTITAPASVTAGPAVVTRLGAATITQLAALAAASAVTELAAVLITQAASLAAAGTTSGAGGPPFIYSRTTVTAQDGDRNPVTAGAARIATTAGPAPVALAGRPGDRNAVAADPTARIVVTGS